MKENTWKAFKDLKVGDSIYYWDHGKMHEQIVNKVELTTEIMPAPYYSSKDIARDVLIIQAGKSPERKMYYQMNYCEAHWGYIKRFSCKESARHYIENLKGYAEQKVRQAKKCLEVYSELVEKYNNVTI